MEGKNWGINSRRINLINISKVLMKWLEISSIIHLVTFIIQREPQQVVSQFRPWYLMINYEMLCVK